MICTYIDVFYLYVYKYMYTYIFFDVYIYIFDHMYIYIHIYDYMPKYIIEQDSKHIFTVVFYLIFQKYSRVRPVSKLRVHRRCTCR